MQNRRQTFHIGGGPPLRDHLDAQFRNARDKINSEEQNYILNVGETSYIEFLIESYRIEPPIVGSKFEDIAFDSEERVYRAEELARLLGRSRVSGPQTVLVYIASLPVSGDWSLLSHEPQSFRFMSRDVYHDGHEHICFEILHLGQDPESLKRQITEAANEIGNWAHSIAIQVKQFNDRLPQEMNRLFRQRKQELIARRKLMSDLGFKLKRRDDVPLTYSVPMPPLRRLAVTKPSASTAPHVIESALDDESYQFIVRIIHDVGRGFERKPSIYKNREEEDLRDFMLMFLESHYESIGSATGETFNAEGKVDILVRHNNGNLFVGECKYWSGPVGLHETLDQLLRYLTWRDSKAAAVMFVRNKDFSNVLETIVRSVPEHPNFVKFVGKRDGTRFDYIFRLNEDPNKEVKLAVLAFHTPKGQPES